MIHSLLKILFPIPCLSCGYLSEALCNKCTDQLKFMPHVREVQGLKICAALYYQKDSILERLIHPFKYKHQANIFKFFVPHMREALKLLMEPSSVTLVPVPLHPKRLRDRGYNQSELLAKWIAKGVGCSVVPLLKRVKDTDKQSQMMSREERLANIENAFELASPHVPRYGQIVLVDDIVTTGSTLLSCQKVLIEGGAKFVSALTLADREKEVQDPWY